MHRMFGFRCFKKNSRNVQLMSKRVAATLVCLRTCEEGIDIFFTHNTIQGLFTKTLNDLVI